jgi:hypothetical protein
VIYLAGMTELIDSSRLGMERLGMERLGMERLGMERLGMERLGMSLFVNAKLIFLLRFKVNSLFINQATDGYVLFLERLY